MKVPRHIFSTIRIIQGTADMITPRYEKQVNLINDYGGKVHGSQHSMVPVGEDYWHQVIVYFDLPKENLDPFLAEEHSI